MIYLDNSATTSFKPPQVINAVTNTMKYLSANSGRSGHSLSLKASFLVHSTRCKMAKFLNCPSVERVIFTQNCTDALNMAILTLCRGHIITTAYEHNSVLRPLHHLQELGLVTLTIISPNDSGYVDVNMIKSAVTPLTRVVVINHVSNVTGAITPINEIGQFTRKNNLLLIVDGAQSVGYLDVDMVANSIDVLAVACHKGLHAPSSIGILAFNSRAHVLPLRFGGTGTMSDSLTQPPDYPECMESGTLPTPLIAGVNRSIDWCNATREVSNAHIAKLTKYAIEQLKKNQKITLYTPSGINNGIVAFNISGINSGDVSNILSEQFNIATRGGLHCAPLIHKHLGTIESGIVRISIGCDNTHEEIEFFIRAINEIANQ